MNIFTVSFFGHRMIENPFPVEQKLENLIRELLYSKEYVEFLIGRDGEFDQIVLVGVLHHIKELFDNAFHFWTEGR